MEQRYMLLYKQGTKKEVHSTRKTRSAVQEGLNMESAVMDSAEAAKLARENDELEHVVPAMPVSLVQPLAATAPLQLTNISWGIEAVGADRTVGLDGKGIRVAILDTGINAGHPAFEGINIKSRDFTNEGIEDTNGHGTHCAGTIAGRDVMGMRIGIARGITDLLIGKVLGKKGTYIDVVMEAIEWAIEEKAHIISMSLGIDFPGYVEILKARMPRELAPLATSIALEQFRINLIALDRLSAVIRSNNASKTSTPVILIGAAGNESKREIKPEFELNVCLPAATEGFISVGALGKKDDGFFVPPFSNTGATLSGPGVDIVSAGPNNGLIPSSGTSMAVPHVAGVAALWAEKLMKEKRFSANALAAVVTSQCSLAGLENQDNNAYGNGMVQAPAS